MRDKPDNPPITFGSAVRGVGGSDPGGSLVKLRARTSVVGTLTASLALALAGPAVAGNDAAESSSAVSGAALIRFPEFAGLADSRALSDPLMLQGKLTDLSGKALSGAQVLLAAWPSNETVSKLPVGGSFAVVAVARTVAGKDGAYQLRSLITPLLTSLSGKDGLDVELDVFHGGRHYVYLTQLSSEGNGSWVHDFVRGVDGQASELRSGATNALDLALDPATGETLGKSSIEEARLRTSDHPIPGGPACTRYKLFATTTAWTTAATAVMRNRAKAAVTFSSGATISSSTGVGIGGVAQFAINGARSRTSGGGVDFESYSAKKGATVARDYLVEIKHQILERECLGDRQGEYRHYYMTNPVGLTGGFTDVPSRYGAWECAPFDGKTTLGHGKVWTENAKAATYEKAFTFKPVDGASFSGKALSGYNENVKIKFKFSDRHKGQWCGHSGFPLESGQRVQGFEL